MRPSIPSIGSMASCRRFILVILLLVPALCSVAHGKRVVVGKVDPSDQRNPWNTIDDFSEWEQQNPLSEGDAAVFLYRRHEAEVNELPSFSAFEDCDFSQATRLCEHWQGEGDGCAVEVRDYPRFLASDVNDCMMGQKVILKPFSHFPFLTRHSARGILSLDVADAVDVVTSQVQEDVSGAVSGVQQDVHDAVKKVKHTAATAVKHAKSHIRRNLGLLRDAFKISGAVNRGIGRIQGRLRAAGSPIHKAVKRLSHRVGHRHLGVLDALQQAVENVKHDAKHVVKRVKKRVHRAKKNIRRNLGIISTLQHDLSHAKKTVSKKVRSVKKQVKRKVKKVKKKVQRTVRRHLAESDSAEAATEGTEGVESAGSSNRTAAAAQSTAAIAGNATEEATGEAETEDTEATDTGSDDTESDNTESDTEEADGTESADAASTAAVANNATSEAEASGAASTAATTMTEVPGYSADLQNTQATQPAGYANGYVAQPSGLSAQASSFGPQTPTNNINNVQHTGYSAQASTGSSVQTSYSAQTLSDPQDQLPPWQPYLLGVRRRRQRRQRRRHRVAHLLGLRSGGGDTLSAPASVTSAGGISTSGSGYSASSVGGNAASLLSQLPLRQNRVQRRQGRQGRWHSRRHALVGAATDGARRAATSATAAGSSFASTSSDGSSTADSGKEAVSKANVSTAAGAASTNEGFLQHGEFNVAASTSSTMQYLNRQDYLNRQPQPTRVTGSGGFTVSSSTQAKSSRGPVKVTSDLTLHTVPHEEKHKHHKASSQAAVQGGGYNGQGGRWIIVGQEFPQAGLNYPFNHEFNYQGWAQANTFYLGDTLLFRYPAYTEMVVTFPTYSAMQTCDYTNAAILCYGLQGTGFGCRIPLKMGTGYFGSGFFTHCQQGQKMVITVNGGAQSYQTQPFPQGQPQIIGNGGNNNPQLTGPQTNQPVPKGPRYVVVGWPGDSKDGFAWNPNTNYSLWTLKTPVYIGDSLVFKYGKGANGVYQVNNNGYQTCTYKNYLAACGDSNGLNGGCVTQPLTGPSYFISSFYQYCHAGQKVFVNPRPRT